MMRFATLSPVRSPDPRAHTRDRAALRSRLAVLLVAGCFFGTLGAARAAGDTARTPDAEPHPAASAPPASIPEAIPAPAPADDVPTTPAISFPPPGQARPIGDKELTRLLSNHGHRLLVVNFWATWCQPCVAEIPYFVEAATEFARRGVLFVGLSADFLDGYEDTVPPFLQARKVPYPNFVLDVDPNTMIPLFSESWRGSLPATFYYDAKGRQLGHRLGALEKEDLRADIRRHLAALGEAKPPNESPPRP